MQPTELAKRVLVFVVVVAVVLAVVGGASVLAGSGQGVPETSLSNPEYAPGDVAVTPVPAEGTIQADKPPTRGDERGIVVIDKRHSNSYARSTIDPLTRALTRIGYNVRFTSGGSDLASELERADAYVVIDPGSEFSQGELSDLRSFTDDGGRVLLVGEPTRIRISGGLFGVSISTDEAKLSVVTSRYGMTIGTQYLYNLAENGGNYRHISATPGSGANLDGVERVTMYTAAPVSTDDGRVLLRTGENTHKSDNDGTASYPVAVVDGNVMLLGDKTFLEAGNHNVGDNEQFIAHVVEFLAGGDRLTGDGGTDTDTGNETADAGNETADAGNETADAGSGDGDGGGGSNGSGNETVDGGGTSAAGSVEPVRVARTSG